MAQFNPTKLRARRLKSGKSATQVSAEVGRGRKMIALYERGDIAPPVDVLAALAKSYGCSVSDFFDDVLDDVELARIRRIIRITRREQGLPDEIEDPVLIDRIVTALTAGVEEVA